MKPETFNFLRFRVLQKPAFIPVLVLFSALLFCSCDLGLFFRSRECTDVAPLSGDAPLALTLTGTKWLYQLQYADPEEVKETGFDSLVIDYSQNGGDTGRYSSQEMNVFKTSGGNRQVLAYLSIGEAEDYRYYFDPAWTATLTGQPAKTAPCWLGRTNPEWAGNYKVQYWSDSWQTLILDYLDLIIDDGFDGVYLDIIDAWEYWADEDNNEGFYIEPEAAAGRMINFVKRLAYHARVTRGKTGFLIFPQNGEAVLEYDTGIEGLGKGDYLSVISGIGIEDLYYNETAPISAAEQESRKTFLEQIRAVGKKIIVVDYVDDGSGQAGNISRINAFRNAALADGYFPYAAAADRALDSINLAQGLQP